LKLKAEQMMEAVKREHPDRTDMKFIKTEAAKRLDIKVRALNERLRK